MIMVGYNMEGKGLFKYSLISLLLGITPIIIIFLFISAMKAHTSFHTFLILQMDIKGIFQNNI
ncbi:hypothetical protein [Klebsiella phage Kpn74]|uniref:Uncharacterized protein n=1 Tax=Klebsiella phage Kpn74 TaxID=3044026 RepID=A0AAT9V571_9CAUD|nr:hypothetical protein [Klebsiella phage Kpn74]